MVWKHKLQRNRVLIPIPVQVNGNSVDGFRKKNHFGPHVLNKPSASQYVSIWQENKPISAFSHCYTNPFILMLPHTP